MIKILVIGSGFGGIYSVKSLLKKFKNKEDIDITLISKQNYFLFTPLLHEVATGTIATKNVIEPIREIIKSSNFHFIEAEVNKIDFNKKLVFYDNKRIDYDYLIIAIGAKANYYGIKEAEKYTTNLKTINDAINIKNRIINALEKASKTQHKDWLNFIVVGGGPTGVELIAEMYDFVSQALERNYKKLEMNKVNFYLIQKDNSLIPLFNEKTRNNTIKKLKEKNIKVLTSTQVTKVAKDYVETNNKDKIYAKTIIWTSGVTPNKIEAIPKEVLHPSSHFKVNEFLEIEKTKDAFAIGDCALFFNKGTIKPIPALAQVAVSQAKHVVKNIKLKIENKKLQSYKFIPEGYLLSIGYGYATGNVGNFTISGFFAWWLWRTIYLFKLIGLTNKLKVAFDWTINLITRRRDTTKI